MKKHTIIFVPHARAKFRKWRISTLQACLVIGTVLVLTLGGILTTVLYFDTTFDRRELELIQAENEQLRTINQGFENDIQGLSEQLTGFQERIRKLAIVAEVAELAPSDAGIGGPLVGDAEAPQGVEMEKRLGSLSSRVGGLQGTVDLLEERFQERRARISSTPAISPVKGLMTSRYGYRLDPFTSKKTFHNGIDIVAPRGKGVLATGDGLVLKAERVPGLGNAVFISHGDGLTTRYGHLSGFNVKAGDKVRRGDVVGFVGNTGRSSGTHLHYEVREEGRPTDPLAFLLDR